jgi:hypothetical protein
MKELNEQQKGKIQLLCVKFVDQTIVIDQVDENYKFK